MSTTSYHAVADLVISWAKAGDSRYICVATTHTLMEAHDSPRFRTIINQADLVTPDGMPLVWMLRLKGAHRQQRVYGPTLMLYLLEVAQRKVVSVGYYGASVDTLEMLSVQTRTKYPDLNLSYSYSPPFRDLSADEDKKICEAITCAGVRILFVGLGCPKQEIWIAEHRGKIQAVMIGVGAAFDFHAGVKPQAPHWMQNTGLEWLFRLLSEPRRLWRRYLYHNPRFIFLAIMDLLGLYEIQ